MLLLCDSKIYFKSNELSQSFGHNTIIFDKQTIHILNIISELEMSVNLSLIQPFPYMKYIEDKFTSNQATYLLNESHVGVLFHMHRESSVYKQNLVFTMDENGVIHRLKKYMLYLAHLKQDVNLLSNNAEKLNNLLYIIISKSLKLNIKKQNVLQEQFHENLFKNIGAPSYTLFNIDGQELYFYCGIIQEATICFLLQLNQFGLPASYMYVIKCTHNTFEQVLVYDDSMIIEHNNKLYNINNYPKTQGEYTIYVSRYFHIGE